MTTLFEVGMPGELMLSHMLGFVTHCLSGKHLLEMPKYNSKIERTEEEARNIEGTPKSLGAPYSLGVPVSPHRQVRYLMQTVLYLGYVANVDGSVLRAMKRSVMDRFPNCKEAVRVCIDTAWAFLADHYAYRPLRTDPDSKEVVLNPKETSLDPQERGKQ